VSRGKHRASRIIPAQISKEMREVLERKAFEEDTTMSWVANDVVMKHFGMSSKDFKHAKVPKTYTERIRNRELYGKTEGKKENQDDFEGFVFLA